jgi:putative transposase
MFDARQMREGWRGDLWQGRFARVVMDEAHPAGHDDGLAQVAPLRSHFPDWADFLDQPIADDALAAIRSGERTGRPLGSDSFVAKLEAGLGRTLARQRPGRKPGRPRLEGEYV